MPHEQAIFDNHLADQCLSINGPDLESLLQIWAMFMYCY